jgi:succinoglycan biosynthesis transport protein ExoP
MTMQTNTPPSEFVSAEAQGEMPFAQASGMSLVDLWRILRVRRRIILGTAVTVVTLATIIVTQLTPLYSATVVVMLDQRKNNVEDINAVLSGLPSDPAAVQNQVQILTSLELAGRVVDKMKLEQDPEFNPSPGGWESFLKYLNPTNWFRADPKTQADAQGVDLVREEIIRKFLDHLSVAPIGLSTAINVAFESRDPGQAARIANAIGSAYVEGQLEAKFEATQKATQWLSGRIGVLSRQAQVADSAVQRYKAEHGITQTAAGDSMLDRQTADINGQLVLAKADLAEKQATYDHLAALARTRSAANAAQVVASPLIATLRAQESDLNREIADLSTKYGPRHPKMLNLQAQEANLGSKIAEEVQRIVESVRNDVDVANSHVASLQASLQQLETQGAGENQAEVQLTALQSAATSARAMYEAFLGRLNQTQDREGIETPDVRVISNAQVPKSPSFPNEALVMGVSIPGGLILGLILAFTAEHLDSGFRTSEQIEKLLGIPVLSTIPELAGVRKFLIETADVVLDKPTSSFTEAIRGLHLGLTLSNVDRKPKVIVIASSVPGEGKTSVAVSLGRLAAKSGLKTIIVDGDLRRPNIATMMKLDAPELGIIEALTGEHTLDQCIRVDKRSAAWVLPCLQSPPNPADVLASEAMQKLIVNLRKVFDLVVIDSAPVVPVNDTKILSQWADAVLFVVRWEKTPREAVANALRSLADVHVPIAGIAMTRADNERFNYYNYGYQNYSKYNKYYGN